MCKMTFEKYPIKTQILLALFLTPLNYFTALLFTRVIKTPFFMDMIFVYAASFFGLLCGIIVGISHCFLTAIIWQHNLLHALYGICCVTGTFFTWLIITRHKTFEEYSAFWSRAALLVFVSTVVISLEGSMIYSFFMSKVENYEEERTIMFLMYNLVLQDFGIKLSSFLARLPVNLFDKAIAVFGGLGTFLVIRKIM